MPTPESRLHLPVGAMLVMTVAFITISVLGIIVLLSH